MSVSYLVTLYNKEEFIAAVFDAALAEQTATGGEIIIYDDASTDRSAQIVEERIAAKKPPAVRLIRGEKNRGVAYATNQVIEKATQPFIRLVDADDILVPGSTAQLMRLMEANKLDFIYGRMTTHDKPAGDQSYQTFTRLQDPLGVVLRHLVANPSSSLFRTGILKSVIPLPEWVRRTQDFSIFLRVACRTDAIGYVNEYVVHVPPIFTANNLSSGSAAAYAELCRSVALEEKNMPLEKLRSVSRRYAGRAIKYFNSEGESRLTANDKFRLWRWRRLGWVASPQTCVRRLHVIADIFDRDRHVIKGERNFK